MASSSDDTFVVLTCTNLNPIPIEADIAEDGEILISTNDIRSWDLDTILHHQTVKVHASRDRPVNIPKLNCYYCFFLWFSFS